MERHLAGCPFCQQELVRFSPLPGLLGRISLADLEDIDGFDLDPSSLGPPGDPGMPEHPSMPLPRPKNRPQPDFGRMTDPNPGRHLVPPVPEQPRPPQRPAAPVRPEPPAQQPKAKGPANRRRTRETDKRTSRRNFITMAAVLVAAVAVSAVFVQRSLASGPPQADAPTAVWQATDQTSKVTASADLTSKAWGTAINLKVANLPAGQVCQLMVHNKNGQSQSVGWWRNGTETDSQVPTATSYNIADIDRMDVVTVDQKFLVDLTPKS
jgi:hypothetical protein